MASVIKVKRSSTVNAPSALSTGELAYSFGSPQASTNNGGRLFIGGMGPSNNLNFDNGSPIVVGGQYFTDMMDHVKGVLTADSALITDANKKLDNLIVDSLDLNNNILSATDATIDSGNIRITPMVGAKTIITNIYTYSSGVDPISLLDYIQQSIALNVTDENIQDVVGGMVTGNVENGISVTYDDTAGKLDFDVNDPTLSISGDATGSQTMVNLANTDIGITLATVNTTVGQFPAAANIVNNTAAKVPVITVNGKGLVTSVTTADIASTLTVKADLAATETISLLSETLAIEGGEGIDTVVSANTITISGEDATATNKGIASFNSSNFSVTNGAVSTQAITIGNTIINSGGSSTTLAGLTSVAIGNLSIAGNTISVPSNTNGNIILSPNGNGTVDVSSKRITNLDAPVDPLDAANKAYVDAARSGLDVKGSVRVATTSDITLSNTFVIDGISIANGDRVLVKNQLDKKTNGIYVVNASGVWPRSPDANNLNYPDNQSATANAEVTSGMFTFVQEGTVNGDSGFVLITNDPIVLGTSELEFALFSTSGTLIAGSGLQKTGDTLAVGAGSGITVTADAVELSNTVAGAGLTYTAGVLDVVGTAGRITVSNDSLDIASTYVGQNTITTLGIIGTGTWNGTTITVPFGGTGVTSFTSKGILYGNGTDNLQVTAAGTYNVTSGMGQLLMAGPSGVPTWTDKVDGGTY